MPSIFTKNFLLYRISGQRKNATALFRKLLGLLYIIDRIPPEIAFQVLHVIFPLMTCEVQVSVMLCSANKVYFWQKWHTEPAQQTRTAHCLPTPLSTGTVRETDQTREWFHLKSRCITALAHHNQPQHGSSHLYQLLIYLFFSQGFARGP